MKLFLRRSLQLRVIALLDLEYLFANRLPGHLADLKRGIGQRERQ